MSMSSPSLFVLHGWSIDPTNSNKWQPFLTALAKQGVPATFLSLPGLSTPLSEPWTLQQYIDWVLSQLPKKPVVLFGHSFGGQIAIRLAAQFPDRVSKLILLDAAGLRDHSPIATSKRVLFSKVAKLGKLVTQAAWARRLLYMLARERDYEQASPVMRRTMAQVVAEEVWQDLAKITAPTLVVWGEADTVTPLRFGKIMARHIPQAQLVVIPQARHSPQYTHIAELAAVVLRFLIPAQLTVKSESAGGTDE